MTRFIRITISLFLLVAFGVGDATAQSVWQPITVTGQVVDAADGQPLVAVHICYRRDDALAGYVLKDITDYDGHFELSYPRKYVMTATQIGYKPQQLHFSSDTTILIRLERDPAVTNCPEIYLVSGVVLDENDEPLIGASVMIKDTDIGVATDINGEFKIEALKGMVLKVTYIGYYKKEIKIKKKEPIIIKLKDTGAMLQ